MLKKYFSILNENAPADDDVGKVLKKLVAGDKEYIISTTNHAELTPEIRHDTAVNGQHPYACVVTCSDARVPPEHIFSAGIGDLFVIRNAGNLLGDFDLGSVEYAVEHLGVKLVLIMGHTHCGAVAAALGEDTDGYIHNIISEVREAIGNERDARKAEIANVRHSLSKLYTSRLLKELHENGKVEFAGAVYDIESGTVEFLED